MSVTLSYDDNQRLLLDGIACDCGLTHQMPDRPIHVGRGLLARAGELISRYLPGTQAVLVADDKTWPLAGREVCEQLRQRGFKVDVCLIRRDGEMLPDETACGEVLLTMTDTTDFLISVGSGSHSISVTLSPFYKKWLRVSLPDRTCGIRGSVSL